VVLVFPLLVLLVGLFMVARGYRMTRASGYRHFLWIDGLLSAVVLLLLLLPIQAGSPSSRSIFPALVLSWIGIRSARIYCNRRLEQADPTRWQRWERALLLTSTFDRLRLRYPVQLYEAEVQ
jgi:hypothetical protein